MAKPQSAQPTESPKAARKTDAQLAQMRHYCPDCKGTGLIKGETCESCDGNGWAGGVVPKAA